MKQCPRSRELAEETDSLMSGLTPTANSGQPTGSLYEKKNPNPNVSPHFYSNSMVSVTQGLNVLEAENWAKCRGDPKVARDRSGPGGGGRDLGIAHCSNTALVL